MFSQQTKLSASQAQSTFLSCFAHVSDILCSWKIRNSSNTCCIFPPLVSEHTLTEHTLLPSAYRIPLFSMGSFWQDSTSGYLSPFYFPVALTVTIFTSLIVNMCKYLLSATRGGLKGRRHIPHCTHNTASPSQALGYDLEVA